MGMKIEEHECNNVDGFCGVCEIPMVGHLTLDEHQEIVEKNNAWWIEFRINHEPITVAIGCKLDPSDKSEDAERRYVEVEE